jgi:hypothetical protein
MKNIMISASLRDALQDTWARISPDAGVCTLYEAVELTLDRLTGPAGNEVDQLIAQFGYRPVSNAAAKVL